MDNFDVAFTAKGFALFIETLAGLKRVESTTQVPSIAIKDEPVRLEAEDEKQLTIDDIVMPEEDSQEVKAIVDMYYNHKPAQKKGRGPDKQPRVHKGGNQYGKSSGHNPDSMISKEAVEVNDYLMYHKGRGMPLKEIRNHMKDKGYTDWDNSATAKMQQIMKQNPYIRKQGFGIYFMEVVTHV